MKPKEDIIMKKDLVELVFILDRSGSMSGLESDTIGGFNSLLEKQKKEKGEAIITTVLFDDRYELLHDRINLKGVKAITDKEYFVRGSTALLDAMGNTISKVLNSYKNTDESERPEKVMLVITTDGLENASREYDYGKVKTLIKETKEKYSFEYIFLGANIDSEVEADRFGIDKERAVNYHSDSFGTKLNYAMMSDAISEIRTTKELKTTWRKKVDDDFQKRK